MPHLAKLRRHFILLLSLLWQGQSLLHKTSQPLLGNDTLAISAAATALRVKVNHKISQVHTLVNDLVSDLVSASSVKDESPLSELVLTRSLASAQLSQAQPVGGGVAGATGVIPAVRENATANLSKAHLAWLHTPKAGTSFANVLIALGCPNLLGEMHQNHHAAIANKFCLAHMHDCSTGHSLCSTHSPINFGIDTNQVHSWAFSKDNFVGMFRKPEQRHISGFYDDQLMSTFTVDIYHGRYQTPLEYAKANAGCSVKLLTGKPCNDQFAATSEMADQAILHLDHGFAFVGLTEEWELSVCLFHRMFGGQCDEREFGNIRPGFDHTEDEYDVSELEGWRDPYDGPLYERAKFLFWSNVAKYEVSWETCRTSICPAAGQYF